MLSKFVTILTLHSSLG